eukprot:11268198-Heterocapsa_arctica.AAC.1
MSDILRRHALHLAFVGLDRGVPDLVESFRHHPLLHPIGSFLGDSSALLLIVALGVVAQLHDLLASLLQRDAQ